MSWKLVDVQSLSHVWLFGTPWTAVCKAALSFFISWNLLKLMSTGSVMLSNHIIFCCPLLWPSIFPSIRVFPNELAFTSGSQSMRFMKMERLWQANPREPTRISSVQFSRSVVSRLFVTPWIAACQASLSITISWSSLRMAKAKRANFLKSSAFGIITGLIIKWDQVQEYSQNSHTHTHTQTLWLYNTEENFCCSRVT